MKQLILFSMFVLLLSSFGVADPVFYFKANQDVDLKIPCANDGQQCSSLAVCNITINDPNSVNIVNSAGMTNNGAFHNYTLTDTDTLGEYQATVFCNDNNETDYTTFSFATTENGFFNDGLTFIISLAIIIVFCIVVALNLNPDFIFLKVLLIVSALLYVFLIPASFIIASTKMIFYTSFLWMIRIIIVYIIIHGSWWLLQKFEIVGK